MDSIQTIQDVLLEKRTVRNIFDLFLFLQRSESDGGWRAWVSGFCSHSILQAGVVDAHGRRQRPLRGEFGNEGKNRNPQLIAVQYIMS
jgi:hypothetical protein